MATPDYGPLFDVAGKQYDIDPLLLQSIAKIEDGVDNQGRPKTSPAGAVGVMQFMPQTATIYGVNPVDPVSSIFGAARYLADLRRQTGDNLDQMLSLYNGDRTGSYAAAVRGVYDPLVAAWSKPPSTQQVVDPSKPEPPPGQRNASFNPPPGTPDVFIPEGTKGKAGQPAPGTPTTASSETPIASFTMNAPAPDGAGGGSNEPPADFRSAIFGPSGAPAAPAKDQSAPAAQPATPTTAADGSDFQTQIFGPRPTQPAPGATGAPPATVEDAPVAGPSGAAPAQAQAAPASAVPDPEIYPTPIPPPAPNWWLRNVKPVFDAADNPLLNTKPDVPLFDEASSGLGQGVRDIGTTLGNMDAWLTRNVPAYAWANRQIGYTPEKAQAQQDLLQAQTKAYEDKYKGNVPAEAGRIGGQILGTAPAALPARALGLVGEAAPYVGRVLGPALEWAGVGGAQNALTSGGTTPADWGQSFLTGGAGGALLGGGINAVGPLLGRAASAVQQEAQNLGFNLSLGETFGGLAKKLEGVTSYFPFSGSATKEAADRANINNILNRNMGMPQTGQLNLDTMNQARAQAGRLMDQIQNITVDGNRDGQFLNALANIDSQARLGQVGPINTMVDRIQNIMANYGGTLPGNELHNLIARGGDLDALITNGTRAEKAYAQGIRTALQDAASRTADPAIYPNATAATQQAVNDFNQGRYFWKTIKTVEPLVGKTGTADDATYAGLARRIQGTPANPNFDPRFSGANNEMQSLARVLNGPLAELKSSGTGREIAMMRLLGLEGGGGLAGAALAGALSPEHLVQAVISGVGLPLAVGQAGRVMRLGLSPGENMLLQRQAAPYVGNLLMGAPPQQGTVNPAALQ